MKTVYIIEDDEIMRDLLSTFLAAYFPELELLGATGNGSEGLKNSLRLAPDLVIMDIQLPDVNGLEILNLLKSKSPKIKILIFTGNTSQQTIKNAVHGNADGFINKISGLEDLERAIRSIAHGEQYFCAEIHKQVIQIRNQQS